MNAEPALRRRLYVGWAVGSLVLGALGACRYRYETFEVPAGSAGASGSSTQPSGGQATGGDASTTAGTANGGGAAASGGAPEMPVGGDGPGGDTAISTGGSSGAGGSGGSAGTGGSAGSGGSGTVADLLVTTNADENDAGASAAAPGGTGLSLREALTIANAMVGIQSIGFANGIVVAQSSSLPNITEAVHLLGGVVNATAVGNKDCLTIQANATVIDGLELYGCGARAIYLAASIGSQITNCNLHDDTKPIEVGPAAVGSVIGPNNTVRNAGSHAVIVSSQDSKVVGNRVLGAGGNAIFLSGTAFNTFIVGNLLVRADSGIGMSSGTSNSFIRFNTIAQNGQDAVLVGAATGVDLRDNILVNNAQYGVSGADNRFTQLSYNLFFGNGLGSCAPCTPGPQSVLTDPLFVNAAADDFTLQAASPARNTGVDVGEDRNGAAAGNFNGAAPDLGFWESP